MNITLLACEMSASTATLSAPDPAAGHCQLMPPLETAGHSREKLGQSLSHDHDDMIIYLEPDILEWKVKWALGNITTNNTSGGDGIPVELFQILKDNAVKVLHSIC